MRQLCLLLLIRGKKEEACSFIANTACAARVPELVTDILRSPPINALIIALPAGIVHVCSPGPEVVCTRRECNG